MVSDDSVVALSLLNRMNADLGCVSFKGTVPPKMKTVSLDHPHVVLNLDEVLPSVEYTVSEDVLRNVCIQIVFGPL